MSEETAQRAVPEAAKRWDDAHFTSLGAVPEHQEVDPNTRFSEGTRDLQRWVASHFPNDPDQPLLLSAALMLRFAGRELTVEAVRARKEAAWPA
jgi:hypothetical protein